MARLWEQRRHYRQWSSEFILGAVREHRGKMTVCEPSLDAKSLNPHELELPAPNCKNKFMVYLSQSVCETHLAMSQWNTVLWNVLEECLPIPEPTPAQPFQRCFWEYLYRIVSTKNLITDPIPTYTALLESSNSNAVQVRYQKVFTPSTSYCIILSLHIFCFLYIVCPFQLSNPLLSCFTLCISTLGI